MEEWNALSWLRNKFSLLQAQRSPWLVFIRSWLAFRARNADRLKLNQPIVSAFFSLEYSRFLALFRSSYLQGYRIASYCAKVSWPMVSRYVPLRSKESSHANFIYYSHDCARSSCTSVFAPVCSRFCATIASQFSSRAIASAFIQLPLEIAWTSLTKQSSGFQEGKTGRERSLRERRSNKIDRVFLRIFKAAKNPTSAGI